VVQLAVAWLQALWERTVESRVPPVDAQVLLAGDHTVWDPGGGEAGAELWAHLRLLFCRAVWHVRCCRAAEGQVFTAATVVALGDVLGAACYQIQLDWLRVTSYLAGASASLFFFFVNLGYMPDIHRQLLYPPGALFAHALT
jgi:hypothetical protein